MTTASSTAELAACLRPHARLMVLTGAGISTASGIPDYRDPDGKRRGREPIQGPEFRDRESVRKRYWARSMVGWPILSQARPNPAHFALAALEAQGRLVGLVTQNVDGLHQHAGSQALVELHGSIHAVVCLSCRARLARQRVQMALEAANPTLAGLAAQPAPDGDAHLEPAVLEDFQVPACPHCGGVLQPDVVFFGDHLARAKVLDAERIAHAADACLVVGSFLMVYSGFRLVRMMAERGKPVVALNLGITRADPLLTLKVTGPCEQVLPELAQQLALVSASA